MTNISAVIAELMEKVEVNSPRIASLHYCLSEAAKRIAELEQKLTASEARCAALAEESSTTNERLQRLIYIINNADNSYCMCGEAMETHTHGGCGHPTGMFDYHYDKWLESVKQTPATEAFLAEVRAQARNEGINYAASRLAAAFNHGFVDKPLAEVFDVVRMILDTKEELANSTLPAADGLSGEYAEEFIENSTVELRKGVQS